MQLSSVDIMGQVIGTMGKDTITVKFTITADDFETIQAIRRLLAEPKKKADAISRLGDTLDTYLSASISADFAIDAELRASKERRTARGPRQPIPKVENGVLTWFDVDADKINTICQVGTNAWYDWLAEPHNKSFRYVSVRGTRGISTTFTAMKRGDGMWYAHKRLSGKLRRKYLGIADNLTSAKLEAVAFELAQYQITGSDT